MSSYGRLSAAQRLVLREFVVGQTVHDLGAGTMGLSRELLSMGALHVIAVDKETRWPMRKPLPGQPATKIEGNHLSVLVGTFELVWRTALHALTGTVSFVSWPPNHDDPALDKLLEHTPIVVYLGKNTDGAACASQRTFSIFSQREVMAHVPEPRNTLIVYGPKQETRPFLPEELAAIDTTKMWTFAEMANTFGDLVEDK